MFRRSANVRSSNIYYTDVRVFFTFFNKENKMGSRTGIADYEFRKGDVVKSVATEVVVVQSDSLEKTVAEEIKQEDPVNAQEVIEASKAVVEDKEEEKVEDEREEDVGVHSEDSEESGAEV